MRSYLDFEKPVAELETKVEELRQLASKGDAVSIADELNKLEAKAAKALADLYGALTPWQKIQVARHQERPHFSDYVRQLVTDFTPLAGDRAFAEDHAIVGGFGRFRGQPVCVMGQEKGSDTQSRLVHNFGMARPEGYRKAARLMELADRFGLPVISLVDTAGAFPASTPRSAARRRPSPAPPTSRWRSASPIWPSSSARAAPAAPSPSPPATRC